MRRKCIAVSCLVITFLVIAGPHHAISAESEESKQVNCSGRILNEQGQPLADVKVTLHEMVYDEATFTYDSKLLGEIQTKNDGNFSFDETVENNRYRYAYIIAAKEDFALGFNNWSMRDGDKELEIILGPPKELAGIIVDEDGNAVPDAQVTVSMLAIGEGRDRPTLSGLVAGKLLTTKTNEAGKFAFTRIPAEATAEFIVKKTARATISTYKRSGGSYEKYRFAEGQKDIKLVLPKEAKIEGVVVEQSTGKPVKDVQINCTSENLAGYFRPKPVVSQEDGSFSIDSLTSDRYVLELLQSRDELPEWVADKVEVITEAGKTKSNIKIELSKGGVLEVKVTDGANKGPVKEVYVSIRNQTNDQHVGSRTDINGFARMRLMPGDYQISSIYKQGYSRQRIQDTVTVKDDKTEKIEYELHGMPKIVGIILDDKDEPIEGVEMEICPGGGREESASKADGKFELIYDMGSYPSNRTPAMFLVGRHYEKNLAAAVQVDEDTRNIEVKLEPAVTLSGQIIDPNDKGIAGVEVRVMMRGPMWGSTIGRNAIITDDEGKYEINALPPGRKYNVYARAEGYGESRGEEVDSETAVNNRLDVGSLTLAVANLSVSGIVVDDEGKPAPGARVYCSGDNQPYRNAQTDIDGKFTLDKVCAGKLRISANKSGATRLYGSVETEGGATDIKIVISQRSTTARYQPKRPPSLVGRPLPALKDVGIDLSPSEIAGKMVVVCLFDMNQRPSRHCVTQLAKKAEQYKGKNVTIAAVQVSKTDQTALDQWKNKYNIPFPVGMITGDAEKERFRWGVRSLPWLILTNQKHIIQATGFRVNEVEKKIGEIANVER